jgi:predicted  nucleic acid-binding Zn-ribbon protein
MKKVLLFCAVFALTFSSCVKNSSEYKALQAEKDSLELTNAKNESELDEILSLLNEVQDNFTSIKTQENYLSVQSNTPGELTPSTRERIHADMQFVTETLNKNREKIAELETKLKNSSVQSSKLQQTLNNLRTELDQKTADLVALKDELERKNQKIGELSESIDNLSKDVQNLHVQSTAQQETITQQQKEINTVYYCFGTTKELKEQKILVNGSLGVNFNKDYFIKVSDLNKLQVISLKAKKGKLISKHPEGSYEFAKDANNQVELRILDAKNFWSLTKYLVVQVTV